MGGHERDSYTLMVQEDEEHIRTRTSTVQKEDEEDVELALISPRIRSYSSILTHKPRRVISRRPILSAAFLLLLVSLISTAVVYPRVLTDLLPASAELDLNDAPGSLLAGPGSSTITTGLEVGDDTNTGNWEAAPAPPNSGWRPFSPSTSAAESAQTERATLSQTYFAPEGCLEAWIAQGVLCPALLSPAHRAAHAAELKMSVVHTWVNGSSAALLTAKDAAYLEAHPPKEKESRAPKSKVGDAGRHFRDHNELVHSLRSVISSVGKAQIDGMHMLTTDLPFSAFEGAPEELGGIAEMAGDSRLGQVPTWLNLDLAGGGDEEGLCMNGPGVSVHHHWALFKQRAGSVGPSANGDEAWETAREKEADEWRDSVLPTFNSIGIETQMGTLAPRLRDTFLYVRFLASFRCSPPSLLLCELASSTFPLSSNLKSFHLPIASQPHPHYVSFPSHNLQLTPSPQFNDDFFLTRPLAPADFSSPLFGSVLRIQRDPSVSSTPQGKSTQDADGEWPSLGYANWLLDGRFSSPATSSNPDDPQFDERADGGRRRGYIQHFAKSFSAPLLAELTEMYGSALTTGASVRFRGDGKGSAPSVAFLAANYVIERYREALLYSYLVLRSSTPGSTHYTAEERKQVLADMGSAAGGEKVLIIQEPIRDAPSPADILQEAGFAAPLATFYSFSAAHYGYAYTWFEGRPTLPPPGAAGLPMGAGKKAGAKAEEYATARPKNGDGWPDYSPGRNENEQPACILDLEECFGGEFLDLDGGEVGVEATMKRIAFEKPRCGDCVVSRVLALSGPRGLSAFLPPADPEADAAWTATVARGEAAVALSLAPRWEHASFPSVGGRARALQLLQRYTHTLGDSPAEFIKVASARGLIRSLKNLETRMARGGDAPAFLVVNDDVSDRANAWELGQIDMNLSGWMEQTWPQKMCWES
ncbi:hypothetical protein FIBSPDRAFT_959374 [Athelia psychrophila]|uniref:Stealth protein CR3 conserved region 3 domain-containing protein n=1 Tax=Athelia psychrophila TaxID=1759441 RepID=A0A166DJJ8_9AGAM|nr:hypothetical protein FIBSPDRAFT_959374 [Fibularhizoctonia sp. CBS 109695]